MPGLPTRELHGFLQPPETKKRGSRKKFLSQTNSRKKIGLDTGVGSARIAIFRNCSTRLLSRTIILWIAWSREMRR
jgi:hypothetical protein